MGLQQLNFEGKDKIQVAIDRLVKYEPPKGYYLGFSGGKDSVVIYDLTVKAGVKFDAHYNISPIDPPEVMAFIKQEYSAIQWDKLARNFWKRMMSEGIPLRQNRWCCGLIKEAGGIGRTKILGMRTKESRARKGYKVFQPQKQFPGTYWLLPVVDWSNEEVWEYIRGNNLPYCPLYDEGFTRLGCVLCPFESPQQTGRNIVRFPKIAATWRRALDRYYQIRIDRGTPLPYESPDSFWAWWISRGKGWGC